MTLTKLGPPTYRPGFVWPPGTYFEALSALPNCAAAHACGSQAEIDALTPPQKPYDPVLQKKRPIVYDPAINAARMDFHPVETTDTQQLHPRLGLAGGDSAFIAVDLRMSPEMMRRNKDDWNRHKAQQLGGPGAAAWLTIRTFYDAAFTANQKDGGNRVALWVMTSNSGNFRHSP